MIPKAPRADAGFTLIEVLVALSILAISLGVLMAVMGDSLARVRRATDEATAVALLESLLEQVGRSVPLRDGDSEGQFPGGFHWRLHVVAYGDGADTRAWGTSARQVQGSIVWYEQGTRQSRALSTLRIGDGAR